MRSTRTIILFVCLLVAVAATDQEKVGSGKSFESPRTGGLRQLKKNKADKQKEKEQKEREKQREKEQKEREEQQKESEEQQKEQEKQQQEKKQQEQVQKEVQKEQPVQAESPPQEQVTEKDYWLSAHNRRRSNLHTSFGLQPKMLQWSDSLARSATNYAELLTELDGCDIEHGYRGDDYGGENLYCHWGTSSSQRPPETVLSRWWEGEKSLGYGRNGHYTQAAWYASSQLGCGVAMKKFWEDGSEKNCYIHVCRYLRPGNCNMDKESWLDNMLTPNTPCTA